MHILKIELDDRAACEVQKLGRQMNAHVGQLFQKGIALLSVANDHQASGGTIIFRHPDGREEPLKI